MTLPSHHPGDTLLIDYAGGALGEGVALAVATHLALCPCCRLNVAEMEAVGGALLEEIEPEEVSAGCLEAVMARLALSRPSPRPTAKPVCQGRRTEAPLLPDPLRSYVTGTGGSAGRDGLESLAWTTLMPGLQCLELSVSGRARARLMRMKGGVGPPIHTHRGLELTLVLDGGFSDELGQYERGDLALGDESIHHRPVADPEGCLCLAVTDGTLRFTGPLGRLLNPFYRF